jgi:hypothetical protein
LLTDEIDHEFVRFEPCNKTIIATHYSLLHKEKFPYLCKVKLRNEFSNVMNCIITHLVVAPSVSQSMK